MEVVLLVIHVVGCVALIGSVLLQSGKGGGMGAGFGGASAAATQVFGGRGAGGFLAKITVGSAVLYMTTSLSLAYMASAPRSALDLTETSGETSQQVDEVIETGSGAPIDGDGAAAPAEAPKVEVKPAEAPAANDTAPAEAPAANDAPPAADGAAAPADAKPAEGAE